MSNILKGIVNEARYPEDPDEYEAMFGARRKPKRMEPDEPQEPYNPWDEHYRRQDAAQAKYNKEVKVEYSDKEGVAPNGERYNSMFVVRAANPYQGDNEIRKFEDLHWGAKKIVDTVKKEPSNAGEPYITAVYYVDNHKYGTWRPWKDEAPTQKPLTFENPVEQFGKVLEGISQEDLANTLCHRIEMRYPDIYKKYDYDAMYNAVDDVASFHAGAEELGSSDINMMIRQVFKRLEESEGVTEAAGAVTFAGKDPNEFQSPKGGKPVMVVVTDQGSRYLITSDGMVLRNKSAHANTGGEDAGLQAWSDKIEFYDRSKPLVPGMMQGLAFPDAVTYLFDKGRIALSKGPNGERVALIAANGAWRPATIADAMPKAAASKPEWGKIVIKADAGTWGTQPKLGWQPLDYNQRGDGTLNRVHNGSPVSHGAKVQQGVAEGLEEAVGGNYLYHGRSVYDAKEILASGYIPQAKGPQKATQAQTKLPTVSVTRDWGYASGSNAQTQMAGIGRDVVFVLDRNAVESNFKTLGTSQSQHIKGLALNPYLTKNGEARSQNTDSMARANAKGKSKYAEPTAKAGGEFEEAVVVPKGALPLKGTMVGFWVNPKSELAKDPAIMNDPRRLDMVRPNQFVKATQQQGVAEGSSSKLSSPFEGGRKTTSITPKHKPLVWENMLGTVMAKDPTSKAEPKYFDYKWEDARAYAKVDQCDDLRICKSPGLYQGWPEKGKMALWGIPRQGVAEGSEDYQEIFQMNTKQGKVGAVVQYKDKKFGFIYGTQLDPRKFDRAREAQQALNAHHNKQGVAEEKGTLWRVHQSEATGRYHVVKGYNKDMKMFKNKMGAGDFNSKASAQAKADELNSSVKETFYRNTDGSIRVVDHKRESKELNVGDTFEYGFFGTKKGIGTVVKLEGFPGKEFVVGKTMDGKTSKFPYRGAMPKNGYYIKKIKSSNIRQSELNEAVDESWINAFKALEANGGEPTLDKPRLFIQQMAIIAKDMGIQPKYTTMKDEWEKVKPFTSLLSQYVDPEGQKFVNYGASIWQALSNAPSMTEIKKYAQQSQSQDVAYQQQQQMSALQHDLTIQQLLRKNELERADSEALTEMDFEARQAIRERQQQLELEAKEKLSQIEIDIRNSREPEEVRKHEFEMARLNHAHEVQVIRVTAEGEMKKAQLEADYQIKIKQLENIDNQQERQNRLDVINTEKYKELARIDAETSAKVKELQAETNAEREKADIEISSQQAQSDIRIREEFMNEFKPIWANLIQRASEAGRTIGQNINAMMAALSRMGKPTMPQANKINELKCWDGYKRVPGTKAGEPGSCEEIEEGELNELSTDRLAKYKTASAADARAADKAGDFARGNKRFAGIVKATKKQFDNETKPKKESAIMKGLVDENLGTPYPGTYEQEVGPFKRKGSERTMKLTTEGKKNVSRRT